MAAGIAAVLALTSRWWLPALPTLFGTIEANSKLIDAFAGLTTIVTSLALLVGAGLAYLGFRSFRGSDARGEARQSVDDAHGGRAAAIGGDVNRSAVVVGDHNRVEVHAGVTYGYSEVAPSSADPA